MKDALEWLRDELVYSRAKWPDDADDNITRYSGTDLLATGPDGWTYWLDQYLHRARVLGLDTPNGRQALAKYAATAVRMVDSVARIHGPLPAPGVPSGEIGEWT